MELNTVKSEEIVNKKNKTLYVTDLDGTLLRSDERTSAYTNHTINRLVEEGACFSYATARSSVTAKKVTEGLNTKFPIICYNGAFILDNATGEILSGNFFDVCFDQLAKDLFDAEIYPIIYAYIDGRERFSYIKKKISKPTENFIATRNDSRKREVETVEELTADKLYYVACIDTPEKLEPIYLKYKDIYHCVYQKDIYSHDQWLEIMPLTVSKANAIRQLKKLLGCERVVAFGDGINDREMFELADESYAVANAVPELKEVATGVIGENNDDAVAKWLENEFRFFEI